MRELYPVCLACEVLEVSVSGYFNWLRRRQASRSGPLSELSPSAKTWTGRACWRCSIVTGGLWRTTTSASLHRQRLAATLRVGGAGEPSRLLFHGRPESGLNLLR